MRQLLRKIFIFSFFLGFCIIFFTSCEKKYSTVIDSAGTGPFLSNAAFSLKEVYSDTMYNNQGLKTPDDLLTIRGIISTKMVHTETSSKIAAVRFILTDDLTSSIVSDGILRDDGISPDVNANDSIYTQYVEYQFNRVFVGKLTLSLWSIDESENQSNTLLFPIEIIRNDNQKPVLSNLQMDTLVFLGTKDDTLQLRITATDLDGKSDIYSVYFNSFRPPNGTPSTNNPYYLFDDGSPIHRDAIAGDGIYSQAIILPASTTIGTYRFEFHAIDRSLDSSNVITRTIVITK